MRVTVTKCDVEKCKAEIPDSNPRWYIVVGIQKIANGYDGAEIIHGGNVITQERLVVCSQACALEVFKSALGNGHSEQRSG